MAEYQDKVGVEYGMGTTGFENGVKKVKNLSGELSKKIVNDVEKVDSANTKSDVLEEKISTSRTKRSKSFISSFAGRIKTVAQYYSAYAVFSSGVRLATAATRSFIDETITTESALRKLNTIMKVNDKALYGYGDALRSVAKDSGLAFSDITAGAYEALSTNIPKEELINFSRVSADFAKAGFTDTVKSTKALTTVMNSYGIELSRASEIGDKFIAAQKEGRFTIDQIAASLSKVIPIAAGANVSFESVLGAMVQLTLDGNTTAQSATQLARLIKELGDESSVLSEVLKKKTSKSFAELLGEGKDLGYIMSVVSEYMDETGETSNDLTESIQAQKGALTLVKKSGDKYVKTIKNINEAQGEMSEGAREVSKDLATTFTNLKTELGNLFWNEDIKNALQSLTQGAVDALSSINKAGATIDLQEQLRGTFKEIKIGDTSAISKRAETITRLTEIMETNGQAAGKVFVNALAKGLSVGAAEIKLKDFLGGITGKFDPSSKQETPAEKKVKADRLTSETAHNEKLLAISTKYHKLIYEDPSITGEEKTELLKSQRKEELSAIISHNENKLATEKIHKDAIKELDDIELAETIEKNSKKLTDEMLFLEQQKEQKIAFQQKLLDEKDITDEEAEIKSDEFEIKQLEETAAFYLKEENMKKEHNDAMLKLGEAKLKFKQEHGDKEIAIEKFAAVTKEAIEKIGKQALESSLRSLISNGDAKIEAMAAMAVEEIAILALVGEGGALIKAYEAFAYAAGYGAQMNFVSQANAIKEGGIALAQAAAITAVAGATASALGGGGGSGDSGGESGSSGGSADSGIQSPEDVVDDATTEEKEQVVIVQGAEPFLKALENEWDDKYDFQVRGTEKKRRR